MKNAILLLMAATILLFGCTGPVQPQEQQQGGGAAQQPETGGQQEQPVEQEEQCEASYAFSKVPSMALSESATFTITATCAGGNELGLYLNDELAGSMRIPNNDPTVLNYEIVAKSDGPGSLVVKSDGETIYAEQITVAPMGSSDVSGTDYDQVSNKKWIAVAFEADNAMNLGSVSGYIKRLGSQTLEGSYVMAQIRRDDGGKPSANYLAVSDVPITEPTLSDNWIYFNFQDLTLQPGKYWVVFSVETEEPTIVSDAVTLHYVAKDKHRAAENNALQMDLAWNENSRLWEQSPWSQLSFYRSYSVVISSRAH